MDTTTAAGHGWPTRYWHALQDERVQCDLCPRASRLQEAQHGFCIVRACQDGAVVLTSYGRSSGYCVDPVEKKPLNHFLPGTAVLSFETAECNLGCRFCQNWDVSKSHEIDPLSDQASLDSPRGDSAAAASPYPVIFPVVQRASAASRSRQTTPCQNHERNSTATWTPPTWT